MDWQTDEFHWDWINNTYIYGIITSALLYFLYIWYTLIGNTDNSS